MGMDIDENAKRQEMTMVVIGTKTTKPEPLKIELLVQSEPDFIQIKVGSREAPANIAVQVAMGMDIDENGKHQETTKVGIVTKITKSTALKIN